MSRSEARLNGHVLAVRARCGRRSAARGRRSCASVVVLPQPDGPSRQKNAPSAMVKFDVLHGDEVAEGLAQIFDPDLGHRASPENWLTIDEHHVSRQDRDEGTAVERHEKAASA